MKYIAGGITTMLELFSMDSCPYCRKVKEFFKTHNIQYTERDVTNPEYAAELMKLGGKAQVPFLAVKDKNVFIYNSDDIIKYVQENE